MIWRLKELIKRILRIDAKSYWAKRCGLFYYNTVHTLMLLYSPGELLIDVGGWNTPCVTWGDFKRRIAVDIIRIKDPRPGVEEVCLDWMKYQPPAKADLITCLQVLEHLDSEMVAPFARKVVESGRVAIISVPYMWPKGYCIHHLQDPVDLDKLETWVGREASRWYIEKRDKDHRLIAIFEEGKPW